MKLAAVCVVLTSLGGVHAVAADTVRVRPEPSSEVAKYPGWGAVNTVGQGWCTDRGVGESLTFFLEPAIDISSLEVSVGNATSDKNADPTALKITMEDREFTPQLERGTARVKLEPALFTAMITIEITAIGKGKTKLSCLRDFLFRDGKGNPYPTLVGVEKDAQEALPAFVAKADAALKSCAAAALTELAGFPFVHTHTTFKLLDATEMPVEKKTKLKDVKALVKACKKRGSFLARGWESEDRLGTELDRSLAQAQSSSPGVVVIGNEANFVVKWAADHWTLVGVGTVKSPD